MVHAQNLLLCRSCVVDVHGDASEAVDDADRPLVLLDSWNGLNTKGGRNCEAKPIAGSSGGALRVKFRGTSSC